MARKYKQVHRKEIDFSLEEWAEVERRAAACYMKTGTYLRRIAVTGNVMFMDMKALAPLLNGMRIINTNINQIARKANETNSIYAEDVRRIKQDYEKLCHMVTRFITSAQWKEI